VNHTLEAFYDPLPISLWLLQIVPLLNSTAGDRKQNLKKPSTAAKEDEYYLLVEEH
jgi:hypothetical protein